MIKILTDAANGARVGIDMFVTRHDQSCALYSLLERSKIGAIFSTASLGASMTKLIGLLVAVSIVAACSSAQPIEPRQSNIQVNSRPTWQGLYETLDDSNVCSHATLTARTGRSQGQAIKVGARWKIRSNWRVGSRRGGCCCVDRSKWT